MRMKLSKKQFDKMMKQRLKERDEYLASLEKNKKSKENNKVKK